MNIYCEACDVLHHRGCRGFKKKTKKTTKWEEKPCITILAWLTLAASNSFWEGGTRGAASSPAQVYGNPTKLWCTTRALKTLIGTKSNRLRLLGQGADRALTCSPSQLSICFHPEVFHYLRATGQFLSPPFFLVTIFALLFGLLSAPRAKLVWYGLDTFRQQRRMSARVPTENDNTLASSLRTYFYHFLLQVNTSWQSIAAKTTVCPSKSC